MRSQDRRDILNPRALVVAYLDPARPQDLHWATVKHLATQFEYIDLIINLPVNSLMRAILGAHHGGGRGPGVAGRFLNHDVPIQLVRPSAQRPSTPATIEAIRAHYDEQLIGLGFLKPARRTVNFPADNPYSTSCSRRDIRAVSTFGTRRIRSRSPRRCRCSEMTPKARTERRPSWTREKSVAMGRR